MDPAETAVSRGDTGASKPLLMLQSRDDGATTIEGATATLAALPLARIQRQIGKAARQGF